METITFVAALRHNKMVAPMVVEGAMTGEMFLAYVENCLVPTLRRNDIVVMDNCRVHLGTGIGRAIETVGATLRYLPKYSPDLNPIEMPYSKFKTFLRKVAARTIPSNRAIRSFIPQLSPQRMCQLFQACRLCFNMIGIRFRIRLRGRMPCRSHNIWTIAGTRIGRQMHRACRASEYLAPLVRF